MAQTLLQAIHISEQEYINTFGTDGWRKSIRNSVKGNHDYLFPPAPKPEQPESPQPQPQPTPPQPAPSPHTSLPPTSAEFVQHVVAGIHARGGRGTTPPPPPHPTPAPTPPPHPNPTAPPPTPQPPPTPSPPP